MSSKPRIRVTTDGRVALHDGFTNVAAQLGTSRDKAAHSTYTYVPLDAFYLANMYRVSWLAKKIVNVIAEDATKRWRTWQAKDSDTTDIEKVEKAIGLQKAVRQALTAARLYGGAAIYWVLEGQNSEDELDIESVRLGSLGKLVVLNRFQLTIKEINLDADNPRYGEPDMFYLNTKGNVGIPIHPSRLALFHGAEAPDITSMWSWGDSELQALVNTIKNNDSVEANVASLIFEANVDVLTIPRLMEMMAEPDGDEKVVAYLKTVASIKGNNGMLVLDGGDTSVPEGASGGIKYERKPMSFAGIDSIWDRFMQRASGASDIPLTRLMGTSPGGMNSTGESDMHNYRQNVASVQSNDVTPALYLLDECLIRSALGDRPEDIYYEWRPIYEPTDKERVEVGKSTAEIISTLKGTNLFPEETIQAFAISAMIETGSLPGLEQAVDDHGLELEDPMEEQMQMAALGNAALTARPGLNQQQGNPNLRVVNDAAPMTLYIMRRVTNAKDILAHYERQGATGLEAADELHVTIAYSRSSVDWMQLPEAWDSEIKIKASGQRLMDQFGDAGKPAQVLLFKCSELEWRHQTLVEMGVSHDHPQYQPHITLAYGTDLSSYEPWTGPINLGPEVWEEVKSSGSVLADSNLLMEAPAMIEAFKAKEKE